jgi:hypothetical protein
MAFQIVELIVDADHNVVERKVMPQHYMTHQEAAAAIESVVPIYAASGYEPNGEFWWAVTKDGKTQIRFIIESV